MAEVAKLVGKEMREYEGQDGRKRIYCGLHLVHLEGSVRGVDGSMVELVGCPREVDPQSLTLGVLYQLDYEHYNTKNGKAARLVDLLEVET